MTSLKINEGPMPKDEAQAEIDAHNRGPWKCFHCGESFGTSETASLHFGTHEGHQPLCTISPEHFRWMEAQHRRNCDDDSEALRTVRSLASEHERLRRRAEEEGYAKGLADAKKYPAELGLMAIPKTVGEYFAAVEAEKETWKTNAARYVFMRSSLRTPEDYLLRRTSDGTYWVSHEAMDKAVDEARTTAIEVKA